MSSNPPVPLTWKRQRLGTVATDRWLVYGPWPAEACGGVWRERGQWRAEVWPCGRKVLGAYYHRRDKAMAHIERWLQGHRYVIAPTYDPRGFKGGRIERRPDYLLEQYVRTHPAPWIKAPF